MRRKTWILVVALVATVFGALAIGEVRARAVFQARLAEAAPNGIAVTLDGIVLWGLASGSIPVTLAVDADTMSTAITENIQKRQGTQVLDVRIGDVIYVDLIRDTPIGELPIEVGVTPIVSNGALTTRIVSVTASGFELPVSVLEGVSITPASGVIDSTCLTLREAVIDDATVVLSADATPGCQ